MIVGSVGMLNALQQVSVGAFTLVLHGTALLTFFGNCVGVGFTYLAYYLYCNSSCFQVYMDNGKRCHSYGRLRCGYVFS